MLKHVTGQQRVIDNFRVVGKIRLARISEAVEKTAVEVVNNARANHEKGAHSLGRYENQTTLLTNSTQPTDARREGDSIISTAVANREYAKDVELGTPHSKAYPFMYPALAACSQRLQERLKEAAK